MATYPPVVVLYAASLTEAINTPNVSIDHLKELHSQASSVLATQGDLAGALTKLDAEIERRKQQKLYPWIVHPMYAAGVTGVLSREDVSLEELQALHSHVKGVLDTQGDLAGALDKLNAKITDRQKS